MQNNGIVRELIRGFQEMDDAYIAFSLYDGETVTEVTYPQFARDILRTASYFSEKHIRGQHVAIAAPNSYRWVVTFFALAATGNTAILLNQDLSADVMQWQCQKADVSMVCYDDPKIADKIGQISGVPFCMMNAVDSLDLEDICVCDPDETILMMLTSGTTGKSKAVEITHGNFDISLINFEEQYMLWDTDRVLTPIPFYHILGFLHLTETLRLHKTVCIGRGVKYLFMDMPVLNPTMLNTVPSIIESLSKLLKRAASPQERERYIGSNLRVVSFGGAALKSSSAMILINAGIMLTVYYGMTEVSSTATWCVVDENHIGTAGKFCRYIEHCFEDGELLLRGPSMMKGYYNDRPETERVCVQGWIHTGDIGYCDEEGYFYLTGRRKNVIILSNGENVNPEEIESTFAECEAIEECLVYSDGKGICADVYTQDQETVAAYVRQYNSNMPLYRQVYKVIYTAEPLPKTGSGKIKRKENL